MKKVERLWAEIKDKMAGDESEKLEAAQRAQHLGKSLLRRGRLPEAHEAFTLAVDLRSEQYGMRHEM